MDVADDRVTRTGWPGRRMPRTAGFWLLGATLLMLMVAASAPSPLYVVCTAGGSPRPRSPPSSRCTRWPCCWP